MREGGTGVREREWGGSKGRKGVKRGREGVRGGGRE